MRDAEVREATKRLRNMLQNTLTEPHPCPHCGKDTRPWKQEGYRDEG